MTSAIPRTVTLVQGAGDRDPDNDPDDAGARVRELLPLLFVWQDGPRAYLVASDNVELTDVDIFDITDPGTRCRSATMTSSSCSRRSGRRAVQRGTVLHHDMVVKQIGGKPILMSDYWDAGYVQMDVSDPANPVLVNDTTFSGGIRCCPVPT